MSLTSDVINNFMPVYFIFLSIFFAFPVALLFILFRKRIFKYKQTILYSLIFTYTLGWVWDWLAVTTGVWRYDSAPTLGVWLGGLPIEEFIGFYTLGTLFIVSIILIFQQFVNR